MTIKLYTEEELEKLRHMRKLVTNPGARWLKKPIHKPVHRQRSFKASSEQDENPVAVEGAVHRFEIYQRQNIRDDKGCPGYPFNRTHPGLQFSRGGSLEGDPGSAGARAPRAAWATPPGAAWWR